MMGQIKLRMGEKVIGISDLRKCVLAFLILSITACALLPSTNNGSTTSIEDMIAGTAAAAQTQTATNLPSITPTVTLTITPTSSIPSATPTATFPFGIFVEAPVDAAVETPSELFLVPETLAPVGWTLNTRRGLVLYYYW